MLSSMLFALLIHPNCVKAPVLHFEEVFNYSLATKETVEESPPLSNRITHPVSALAARELYGCSDSPC